MGTKSDARNIPSVCRATASITSVVVVLSMGSKGTQRPSPN
jgi:hypothetical protein